jgi:hypothetical protein
LAELCKSYTQRDRASAKSPALACTIMRTAVSMASIVVVGDGERERERQVGYVGGYKEGEGTFSHDPANSDLCWCACLVWHVSKSGKVVDVFSL